MQENFLSQLEQIDPYTVFLKCLFRLVNKQNFIATGLKNTLELVLSTEFAIDTW